MQRKRWNILARVKKFAIVVVFNLTLGIYHDGGRITNLPSFTAANPLVFGEDGVAKVWTNGEGEVRLVDSVVHRVMRTIVKQDGQSECKVRRICTVGTFLVNARGALDAGAGRVGNSQC